MQSGAATAGTFWAQGNCCHMLDGGLAGHNQLLAGPGRSDATEKNANKQQAAAGTARPILNRGCWFTDLWS